MSKRQNGVRRGRGSMVHVVVVHVKGSGGGPLPDAARMQRSFRVSGF